MSRRFLMHNLKAWQVSADDVDRAMLLTSEAVTNAVVHARTDSSLTVALVGSCLEVGVSDLSAARPPQHPVAPANGHRRAETRDPLAESGRGMLLIGALADAWKVQDLPGGKQVWFRFEIDRIAGESATCTCDDAAVDAVTLASGVAVVDMLTH